MVSVIVVCWRRFDNLDAILKAWLNQPEVDEVILWDNSGRYKTDLPITLINSNKNINPSIRYLIATMAKNELVMHCDDDVMPKTELVADFLKFHQEDWFSSVEGMFFTGNSYFNQKRVHARNIESPEKVELVIGNLTMINKKHLFGHDYLNFSKYQLEMCLQGIIKGKIEPMVIPSKNYEELPEAKDANALHLDDKGKPDKERLYRQYFAK